MVGLYRVLACASSRFILCAGSPMAVSASEHHPVANRHLFKLDAGTEFNRVSGL